MSCTSISSTKPANLPMSCNCLMNAKNHGFSSVDGTTPNLYENRYEKISFQIVPWPTFQLLHFLRRNSIAAMQQLTGQSSTFLDFEASGFYDQHFRPHSHGFRGFRSKDDDISFLHSPSVPTSFINFWFEKCQVQLYQYHDLSWPADLWIAWEASWVVGHLSILHDVSPQKPLCKHSFSWMYHKARKENQPKCQ